MGIGGGLLGWLCAAVAVVAAGLFALALFRHNLRIRRVRSAYRSLPDDVKVQVLRLVQEASRGRPAVTFLRLDEGPPCDGLEVLTQSHVGGDPYAEAGDDWPGEPPAKFLLQVRLDEPGLGPHWQGRLLTVFLAFDAEQVVRSYATPSPERYAPLAAKSPLFPYVRLTPLRFPADDRRDELDEVDEAKGLFPVTLARLSELAPGIPEMLSQYTDDSIGVLAQILRPGVGYNLEDHEIAYVGADPMLIQNPHEAVCDECGRPMQFLFQFGEIIPGLQMADAGVGYVYGCDAHPGRCRGFVDSH